jgi:hypothetical protein
MDGKLEQLENLGETFEADLTVAAGIVRQTQKDIDPIKSRLYDL